MSRWRTGSCHCGAVRFEADAPDGTTMRACTCSMCEKVGYIHVIVPQSRFRLLQGGKSLTSYRFNTGVADHLFCSVCGVKGFYRPRSNPDGWSINARCLDDTSGLVEVDAFDGAHWEAQPSIAHLSAEAHDHA
ncbi:MAG: GFA family protein [Brevundimonas sp.]|nr:MAG: GFA family protein [Brevundimonas sp.]